MWEGSLAQAVGRMSRESYIVGASGGGIAAASYIAGLTPEHLLDIVKRLSHHTRKHGLWWRVRDPLKAAFEVRRMIFGDSSAAESSAGGKPVLRHTASPRALLDVSYTQFLRQCFWHLWGT